MRMIVDMANLENSLTINSTGQSGHAFHPHYDDMVDSWRKIGYYSMLWDKDAVVVNAAAHLTLIP
ncbi:MAG: penicillin acylase family protein [Chroococcidiopsidaceae cyanobacterium CP_BM_ER_R8_30]|nr:penicillin acylase family protein [Chroococcidiopsidaceae cyanobacterium CP_BM_ER_R8_30]